jgi:zinc transport system substrate-binding protein
MRYTLSLAGASLLALSPAWADVPLVVADIPPVHSLAAQVMGDLGAPLLLLERGGNAHDYQLRPSDAAALADAGLVVWIGPELTPWLDRALDGLSGSGARLTLLEVEGTEIRQFGAGPATEASSGGHDHADDDHGDDEAEDDHADGDPDRSHGGADPHAWLDPANARLWLGAIADNLSRLDPENAAAYAANAEAAASALGTLDAGLADRMAPMRDKPFVVFHDAYGYFVDHYGLTVAGSVALGDAASPGAARLRDLQAGMAAGGALCIFPEANHDAKLVAAMAEGTGARIGGALDPEGAAVEPGPGAYAAILTGLADTLADCLAASG